MKVTFLGTGTSAGIPVIGCNCDTCTSSNPKNKRFRTSIAVENNGRVILVDTSTDLRIQALTFGLRRIDSVFFTHHHADHTHGIDDLRPFNIIKGEPIQCYGDKKTLGEIRSSFGYIFDRKPWDSWKPTLELIEIVQPISLYDMKITPVAIKHGYDTILGFRFDDFAYLTDCSSIPDESMPLLGDLKVLVLSALRDEPPHRNHLTLKQAVCLAQRIAAGRTYFIHMTHSLEHESTNRMLPPTMELAYDGLILNL